MTKAELVDEVARAAELTKKDSEVVVEEVFRSIIDCLNKGDVYKRQDCDWSGRRWFYHHRTSPTLWLQNQARFHRFETP